MPNNLRFSDMWADYYDTLDEDRKVQFLYTLKKKAYIEHDPEALKALNDLAVKWINSPIAQ